MAKLERTEIRGLKVQDRSDAPFAKLGMWASLVGLIALTFWALDVRKNAPDPHYEMAVKQLARYEDNKHPDGRDYSRAVYAEALEELALVDPESVSGPAASALAVNIKLLVARQAQARADRRKIREDRRNRRRRRRANDELATEWHRTVGTHETEDGKDKD